MHQKRLDPLGELKCFSRPLAVGVAASRPGWPLHGQGGDPQATLSPPPLAVSGSTSGLSMRSSNLYDYLDLQLPPQPLFCLPRTEFFVVACAKLDLRLRLAFLPLPHPPLFALLGTKILLGDTNLDLRLSPALHPL